MGLLNAGLKCYLLNLPRRGDKLDDAQNHVLCRHEMALDLVPVVFPPPDRGGGGPGGRSPPQQERRDSPPAVQASGGFALLVGTECHPSRNILDRGVTTYRGGVAAEAGDTAPTHREKSQATLYLWELVHKGTDYVACDNHSDPATPNPGSPGTRAFPKNLVPWRRGPRCESWGGWVVLPAPIWVSKLL